MRSHVTRLMRPNVSISSVFVRVIPVFVCVTWLHSDFDSYAWVTAHHTRVTLNIHRTRITNGDPQNFICQTLWSHERSHERTLHMWLHSVWHMKFWGSPWVIHVSHMWDMSHLVCSYVWHDSLRCHSYVRHDSQRECALADAIEIGDISSALFSAKMWLDSFKCGIWLIHLRYDSLKECWDWWRGSALFSAKMWRGTFICGIWLIYLRHDSPRECTLADTLR